MGESNEETEQNRTKRRPRSSNAEAADLHDQEPPKDARSEGLPSPSYEGLQNRICEHLVRLEVHQNDRGALPLSGTSKAKFPTRGDTYSGILEAISSLYPDVDENLVGEAHQDLLDTDRIYIDQTRSRDLGTVVYRACTSSPNRPESEREDERPPIDLIPANVAVSRFLVSRTTLQRALKKGTLRSFRKPNAPSNALHMFSEADLAMHFERRRK